MLNPPKEIGGMWSSHEQIAEFARLSLTWKKTWIIDGTGGTNKDKHKKKTAITVDHNLLLQDGVLILEEEEKIDDENVEEDNKEEDKIPNEVNISFPSKEEVDSVDSSIATTSKSKNNNSDISRPTKRLSMNTVKSLLQMVFLYLLIVWFLRR